MVVIGSVVPVVMGCVVACDGRSPRLLGLRVDRSSLDASLCTRSPCRGDASCDAARAGGWRFSVSSSASRCGALLVLDQRLTVGDRDLIVVGMDFAEGEEAVAVAAVFDEGGLQRRFDPRDLGEIDVAAKLFALRGFEIEFFDAVAADHHDPGLFRVGGIDKHFVGHLESLGGGRRARRPARIAQPGDATVCLIRG